MCVQHLTCVPACDTVRTTISDPDICPTRTVSSSLPRAPELAPSCRTPWRWPRRCTRTCWRTGWRGVPSHRSCFQTQRTIDPAGECSDVRNPGGATFRGYSGCFTPTVTGFRQDYTLMVAIRRDVGRETCAAGQRAQARVSRAGAGFNNAVCSSRSRCVLRVGVLTLFIPMPTVLKFNSSRRPSQNTATGRGTRQAAVPPTCRASDTHRS